MTKMVDIGSKEAVARTARARGEIALKKTTIEAIQNRTTMKGDVLSTAQIAAILAVKNTPHLIPLCHNIPIDSVDVNFDFRDGLITCECQVRAHYRTGVEMESLAGAAAALLTIWDMVKYLEKDEDGQYPGTSIRNLVVASKHKGD